MASRDIFASVGGYDVEHAFERTPDSHKANDPEFDILKIVNSRDSDGKTTGPLFYRHEIDDLITVLEYWRDYYPGRGRNVRSEF